VEVPRSDRADPEDVGAMLRPFHARLRAEIERVGGTLDKLIGVNTGEALVGLECAADSEGVVGEATWRATRALFEYKQLAPVQVKGKAEPVPIWRRGPGGGRAALFATLNAGPLLAQADAALRTITSRG
jgi:class 3 adenylate cyclase